MLKILNYIAVFINLILNFEQNACFLEVFYSNCHELFKF